MIQGDQGMDQMDWEEEKLYVQFSTIYLLKQTVKN